MARRTPARALARALLPCGLHPAGGHRRHRLSEQGRHLRHPVQGLGRDPDHDRGRPQASGRPHRHHLGSAHLGLGAHPPSARPHDRAGRRHRARWLTLGVLPAGLLPAGAGALAPVPPAVAGEAYRGSPTASVLRQSRSTRQWAGLRGLSGAAAQDRVVVYSKRPFGGPEAVVAYLSRYTHRVAISNSRLIALDNNGVTFSWKDYRIKGRNRYKAMTLATYEFIRRFLIHILPNGFHRIRHYGLFASSKRVENIARIRELLVVPPPQTEPADAPDRNDPQPCPHCGAIM